MLARPLAVLVSLRMTVRFMLPCLAILAIAGIAGCEGEDIGCLCSCESVTGDLTVHLDELRQSLTGTFEGEVAAGDTVPDGVPCDAAGKTFTLELQAAEDFAECGGSEDEQDVPCTRAHVGGMPVTGSLTLDGTEARTLSGGISVMGCKGGNQVFMQLTVEDAVYPLENFWVQPQPYTLGDTFDQVSWDKRHSGQNDDPVVWETCMLNISERSQ